MSASIDQRIVSMKFDNKQFESGVGDSLKSLSKLEKGLDLSNSAKGLNAINESARRISFDGLSDGIESVKVKFSALQVMAITALSNITNSAINAGKRLASAFTIDPIKDGFREYETQMNSIQTIMANTASKGTTLKEVNDALQELNTYSDKTIYNFTEMSKNIGTFTAAGVDLQTSTAAIKGIANLAAVSGSNSQQASTAMYQLSQAIASGTVKLQDWNSVVNAGMGGQVFQDALIETAKVHGIAVDEMIKDEGSFRETLQKGWLTSQVLTETLSKFTGDLNEEQLKSMGYTDQQITEIIKMGQMANEAATKVKTLSQLMDTLKEAVGSGWAQTWQIVLGDFEEAKVLFTSASDVLGSMINKSAEARNNMLQGWKDLGGRAVLIDSIKNAFDGVMSVVKAVSEAFREIFPPTTSDQLYNFTVGLRNLTEHLKLSDETLTKLKSTFKGAFAILDIGKTILLAVGNAISIMLGGTGDLLSTILGVTASFGDWLVMLDKTIKQSNIFNNVLSKLAWGIRNGLDTISFVFNKVVEGAGALITILAKKIDIPGFEFIHNVLGLIGRRMTSIGEEADVMATTVGGAFVKMGKSISNSKIGLLFENIWEMVKKVSNAVGVLVNRMVDSITTSFQNADFSVLLDAVAGISIGGMLLAFKKFMKGLTETVEESKGFLSNITGVLDDVRGSLEAYQQNLKAGVLVKLGTAIALLAASIVAISLIDSGKLVSSLAAIGTLFTQLLVAMKIFTMISDSKSKVTKASAVMIAMSLSILILSGAMKKLADLDWNGIAKGTVGITALAGVLVAAAKILSNDTAAIIKGSAGMVVFALAIKVLSSACVTLSQLSWEGITKGLVGVGILMTEISLFLNNTTFSAKSIVTATGIVILAAAMKILASACADFGEMSWESISKGLVSIGALLLEIGIFSKMASNSNHMISTGVGLIALAAAMKILASAMTDFGSMSWDAIGRGLTVMAGALTEIIIAMRLMPKDLIITATGLILVGAALQIMSSALIKMGDMSWDSIGKGLVILGGSLTILSIALHAMNGTLAGSAALLIAAGALAIIAPTLSLLGAMSWESIIKGLVSLAGAITIFGLSAVILSPVIPAMLGLAASFVVLGVAMVGVGAGLALVGIGLSGLAAGFTLLAGVTAAGATAIVTALGIIITGVAALIPTILGKIGEGIVEICKVITNSIPAIMDCVSKILKAVIDCIVLNTPIIIDGVMKILSLILDSLNVWVPIVLQKIIQLAINILDVIANNAPKIIDGVMKILSGILDSLIKWMPVIIQKVADLLIAMLNTIAINIPKFVASAVDIIVAFLSGISDNLNRVIDSAFKVIISFINGLADAIRNNSQAIADACYNLVTAIVDGITSLGYKFIDAGVYAVEGFIKGLLSVPGKLLKAGQEIAKKALSSVEKALDINSPSKEFKSLGEFSVLGFIDGLGMFGNKVINASTNIGDNAINSMSNTISEIYDMFNSDIDSNPVIRPVLDLTDIQNGSNKLYSLMDGLNNYNLNSSIKKVTSDAITASSLINGGRNNLTNSNDYKSTDILRPNNEIHQVVNIHSPKYLNPSEIARQNKIVLRELVNQY